MRPLPLNLCVFDTAKGHFGRTSIYQRTIDGLLNQIPLDLFANRYVHLQVAPDREDEAPRATNEMVPYYTQRRFQTRVTEGSWRHFDDSHQRAYGRGLITMYTQMVDQRVPYVLHLESDWLFDGRGQPLIDHLERGLRYLDASPTVLSLRIPRFVNEVARLAGVRAKHGIDVDVAPETRAPFENAFYRHSDNLSLNPSLYRTRDLYAATRMLDLHFDRFGYHVEMGFTHCLRWLSPDRLPYAIYNPDQVNCLHIGTREGEEDTVPPACVP